jgi:mannose-6-phosphate isomerase-like protein (cupin superfamily)
MPQLPRIYMRDKTDRLSCLYYDAVTGMWQSTGMQAACDKRGGVEENAKRDSIQVDDQTPHEQDELYVVRRGSAQIVRNAERSAVKPDDL